MDLVRRAIEAGIPFRAVVADCFYREDQGVQEGSRDLETGYVLAFVRAGIELVLPLFR